MENDLPNDIRMIMRQIRKNTLDANKTPFLLHSDIWVDVSALFYSKDRVVGPHGLFG